GPAIAPPLEGDGSGYPAARGETENADSLWVHSKASCILSRYAHGLQAIGYRQGNRFGAPPAHLSRVRCLVVTGPHDAIFEQEHGDAAGAQPFGNFGAFMLNGEDAEATSR